MDFLFLVGRVIFGGFFIYNGINHFQHLTMMSNYAKSKGVPLSSLAVALTGILLILGGLSILLGAFPIVGIILLALFLILVSFMMHNFWTITDPQMKMGEMINFMKNMALLGALFMFLSIPTPWTFGLW